MLIDPRPHQQQADFYVRDADSAGVRPVEKYLESHGTLGVVRVGNELRCKRRARRNQPLGVAADGTGRWYVADSFNAKIRRIGLDGQVACADAPAAISVAHAARCLNMLAYMSAVSPSTS